MGRHGNDGLWKRSLDGAPGDASIAIPDPPCCGELAALWRELGPALDAARALGDELIAAQGALLRAEAVYRPALLDLRRLAQAATEITRAHARCADCTGLLGPGHALGPGVRASGALLCQHCADWRARGA